MKQKSFLMMIFMCMALLTAPVAFAQDSEATSDAVDISKALDQADDSGATSDATESKSEAEKEVDISDLQDEYWRPQKDELEVIQDKEYIKKGSFELGASLGFLLGGGFTDDHGVGFSLGWHFLERLAIEAQYFQFSSRSTNFLTSVQDQFNFTPDFNVPETQIMGSILWTPIYAKFSLLGRKISHFETYIGASAGSTKTSQAQFTWGTVVGERFFITEWLVFKVEWRMTKYTDKINVSQGSFATRNGGPGFVEASETKHNMVIGFSVIF